MVLKYAYLAIATNDDDDISDEFVSRLACDSIKSESDLRQLFRHSQGWDENLQAIVINGTKTHNPDYILVQCNEYFLRNQLSQSIDSNGDEIFVCHDCRDKFYKDNNVSQSSQREEVSV